MVATYLHGVPATVAAVHASRSVDDPGELQPAAAAVAVVARASPAPSPAPPSAPANAAVAAVVAVEAADAAHSADAEADVYGKAVAVAGLDGAGAGVVEVHPLWADLGLLVLLVVPHRRLGHAHARKLNKRLSFFGAVRWGAVLCSEDMIRR